MSLLSFLSETISSGIKTGMLWERIGSLLRYQPDAPMLFSTGLFFFLFIVFFAVYWSLRRSTTTRIVYVALFSLYFYYKSSGLWFVLLIFTATSDFLIARAIAQTSHKGLQNVGGAEYMYQHRNAGLFQVHEFPLRCGRDAAEQYGAMDGHP